MPVRVLSWLGQMPGCVVEMHGPGFDSCRWLNALNYLHASLGSVVASLLAFSLFVLFSPYIPCYCSKASIQTDRLYPLATVAGEVFVAPLFLLLLCLAACWDAVNLFAGMDYSSKNALVDYRVKQLAYACIQAVHQNSCDLDCRAMNIFLIVGAGCLGAECHVMEIPIFFDRCHVMKIPMQ
ncbi:hypothetical protein CK203_093932 [Vitis vinifera]|uniref:Uncharacterized protein n=1 Tax=Vitis vinifera TaxID=29760 RepID=A0A438CTD1_VITVI|nr:hypothetical protein CK203_093932 [Vitis vinifera]